MATIFQRHVEAWKNCRRCELHKKRSSVVLSRGRVPCDVLFIGEAPGPSEDVLGKPFIGPAGKLLDDIIERAFPGHVELGEDGHTEHWVSDVTYALTNLVACIPLDDDGAKFAQPDDACIKACAPRLKEFVRIADPKLIVCVGSLASEHLDPKRRNPTEFHKKIKMVDIVHPAAILRANVAQRGLAIQRCVVTLSNAVEDLS